MGEWPLHGSDHAGGIPKAVVSKNLRNSLKKSSTRLYTRQRCQGQAKLNRRRRRKERSVNLPRGFRDRKKGNPIVVLPGG